MSTALTVAPVLRRGSVPTLVRNGVLMSLTAAIAPMLWPSVEHYKEMSGTISVMIVLKEVFLGVVMGYMIGIVFWAIECAGNFIDTQLGTSMGSVYDPLLQSSDTPTAILFTQTAQMLFFSSGGFLFLVTGLYASYQLWPIGSFTPKLDPRLADFVLSQADVCMSLAFSFAAPVVLALFFVDFGLGLVNRFVPQLQVFFMAMPIKSALSAILIYFFLFSLLWMLQGHFRTFRDLSRVLENFL
jgi:type III secretion protein T